jgi:hypothetical protein
MINSAVLIGAPLNFKNKLNIYPPSVREVVTNPNFGVFYKLLTLTQDDIKEEIGDKLGEGEQLPTPFEYLMLNCRYREGFSILMREAFAFFCKVEINFLFQERKIVIGNLEE